jgi:ferric-dicitrate binding protein FerR (iron transport regulator)
LLKDSKHIDNLIARYLAGEASPEEQQQLRQWMDHSEENKKYFGDFRFVHDKAVASHKYQKVDVDKAWNSIYGQIRQKKSIKTQVKGLSVPFYRTNFFRVAASITLIIGISLFFYIYLNKNFKTSEFTAIVSIDSTLTHTFKDNTKVVLNRKTKITYKNDLKRKQRELHLSGEAYIEVEHSEKIPLIVVAEETFIKDIGTSFNIKAYPDSNIVEVYVESGEVVFYTQSDPGIHLAKGETGIYNKDLKVFNKLQTPNTNVLSYKTHLFVFQNTRLADVVIALNSVYSQKITIGNTNLYDCAINVTFSNETMGNIVDIIAETLGLQVKTTENGYILTGDYCIPQP